MVAEPNQENFMRPLEVSVNDLQLSVEDRTHLDLLSEVEVIDVNE